MDQKKIKLGNQKKNSQIYKKEIFKLTNNAG